MTHRRAESPRFFQPYRLAACIVLALLFSPSGASAQSEAAGAAPRNTSQGEPPSPRGALWRAAALPGWGQYYNRQYYKIPIVYAGLGGAAATALYLNRNYLLYRHAYQYAAWQERLGTQGTADPHPEHPHPEYRAAYQEVTRGLDVDASQLRPYRDNYRRNRDLSYFGIGLVYGLSILDAYVSAHLLDFDVGEDLTFSVFPHPSGITATTRFTLK